MAQTFDDLIKEVVNRFLQNILFIDDKAYQPDNKENGFDASQISSVFAKNGKLCTIFAPLSEHDLCQCSSLFSKADAIVLDWYLDLTSSKESLDDEKDAESDEPRGFYTKYLIEEIVADAKNEKLKIVVVYTGETDLEGITEEIHKCIAQYGDFQQGDCCVYSSNVVIVVRAKFNGEEQFKHLEDLKEKVIKYEDMPDFINEEFAKYVNGLLSIFALFSISIIRENTSRLLNVYSPELDIAYLGHRMVLPHPDDAKDLLVRLFGESITDLITSISFDTKDWLLLWIKDRYSHPKTIKIDNKNIQIDKDCITKMLSNHADDFEKNIKNNFNELSRKEAQNIHKNAALLLDENIDMVKKSNILFAKLTHHKNVFLPPKENPCLTLGTIVYSSSTNSYYLCIQQRCDSLRIDGIRRFLFLPLVESGGETHVVVTDEKQLQVAKSSYDIKTVKFQADKEKRCVCSKRIEDKETKKDRFVFFSIHEEEFEWVLELKDLHAQRILNSYSAHLSRVGLDESEWLRLLE